MNRRINYLLCALVTMLAGLASRRYGEYLPNFLAEYSGDALWALMLFLVVSVLISNRSLANRFRVSMVVAFLVEFSQLYHAPWIDAIRQTTLGGLVLGFGFLWTDLVCYSVGITIGTLTELALRMLAIRLIK